MAKMLMIRPRPMVAAPIKEKLAPPRLGSILVITVVYSYRQTGTEKKPDLATPRTKLCKLLQAECASGAVMSISRRLEGGIGSFFDPGE